MFSLFKRSTTTNEQPVPEWADFFEPKEYAAFLEAVDRFFSKKNIAYQIDDGVLIVGENPFGFEKLGLANLSQSCKIHAMRDYRTIVSDHFETMIKAQTFDLEFGKLEEHFENVRQYIAVRIYPNDYLAHVGSENIAGRPVTPHLFATLVYDLPHSIINVKPEQIAKWGVPEEKLMEIGLDNVRRNYPFRISYQQPGEFGLWFVQGDHFFTPNIVFDFDRHPELLGSKGSLVGIPHRHAVLIYPIENEEALRAAYLLIHATAGMFREGPGSVSSDLYWYTGEEFILLPYTQDEESLTFQPPQEFLAVFGLGS